MPSFRKMAVLSVIEQVRKELQVYDRSNLPGGESARAAPSALSAGGQLAEGACGSAAPSPPATTPPCFPRRSSASRARGRLSWSEGSQTYVLKCGVLQGFMQRWGDEGMRNEPVRSSPLPTEFVSI